MIVGGPNARTDYHYDECPEFFYQLEGDITLQVQDDGVARDIPLRAGEIFYLPPRVPHSPNRAAGSIGLVIERPRVPGDQRSEERRVGKACVSTGRSRGAPVHQRKNNARTSKRSYKT